MNPSILLRIGSGLSLLYFLGHTMGRPWTPAKGPEAAAVVEAMRLHRFDVFGMSRAYWDFYQGFGLANSVHLFVQTIVLWLLASLARSDPALARRFIALFFVGVVANAVLAWRYFFPLPTAFAVSIAVCLGLAFVAVRPRQAAA
jgi:uncharacterized membrane protein YesL